MVRTYEEISPQTVVIFSNNNNYASRHNIFVRTNLAWPSARFTLTTKLKDSRASARGIGHDNTNDHKKENRMCNKKKVKAK